MVGLMSFPDFSGVSDKGVVLVVDDEDAVRETVERMLRTAGFVVQSFRSVQEFLGGGPFSRPACLVLDLLLPGQSGLELQRVMADEELAIPIVFMTGYGDVTTSVQAMKAGAVDFLQKPLKVPELTAAVRSALTRDRKAAQEGAELESLIRRYRSLTRRQKQVFDLVAAGLSNKEIAVCLEVAEKTVKAHRGQVMIKMEASSLADLVRMASKLGIEAGG